MEKTKVVLDNITDLNFLTVLDKLTYLDFFLLATEMKSIKVVIDKLCCSDFLILDISKRPMYNF